MKARGGEERCDCVALAVADFEGEEAVGGKRAIRGGDEASVDVESVLTGEECGSGFVVADFDGKRGA